MRYQNQLVIVLMSFGMLSLSGCNRDSGMANAVPPAIKFTTEYQAVHLDNGQMLFGKLEQAGSDYPVLRNVFAEQSQVNQTTKEVTRVLVKRSVELHNPDYMVLNAKHIVAIEPVANNSRVAEVIKQANTQPVTPPNP
jgi:hypothetical protein